MKLAVFIASIGAALIAVALPMRPFITEGDWSASVRYGDSEAYHEARTQAVTSKYILHDYGVTLLCVAVGVALLRTRNGISTPGSTVGFLAFALAAPALTVAGLVFDLFLRFERREYPPWADSLGIPLHGIRWIGSALLAWSVGHLAFLYGVGVRKRVRLTVAVVHSGSPWLRVVIASTAVIVAIAVAGGEWFVAVPGFLWIYVLASIQAAGNARRG